MCYIGESNTAVLPCLGCSFDLAGWGLYQCLQYEEFHFSPENTGPSNNQKAFANFLSVSRYCPLWVDPIRFLHRNYPTILGFDSFREDPCAF